MVKNKRSLVSLHVTSRPVRKWHWRAQTFRFFLSICLPKNGLSIHGNIISTTSNIAFECNKQLPVRELKILFHKNRNGMAIHLTFFIGAFPSEQTPSDACVRATNRRFAVVGASCDATITRLIRFICIL